MKNIICNTAKIRQIRAVFLISGREMFLRATEEIMAAGVYQKS